MKNRGCISCAVTTIAASSMSQVYCIVTVIAAAAIYVCFLKRNDMSSAIQQLRREAYETSS
jgi:hypothetical protein